MAPPTQHFPWRKTELSNLILRIFLALGGGKGWGCFQWGVLPLLPSLPSRDPGSRSRLPVSVSASPYVTLGQGLALQAPWLPHMWKGDNRLAFMKSWD